MVQSPPPLSWRRRWSGRLLVLQAMGWLVLISTMLHLLPFRIVARLFLGQPSSPQGDAPLPPTQPVPAAMERIGYAVGRAAGYLPRPARCLSQAIAARTMLARRGHASLLHLSARFGAGADSADAHAWLTWHGRVVIGGGKPADQVELACFGPYPRT